MQSVHNAADDVCTSIYELFFHALIIHFRDNRVTGRSLKGENARDLYIQTQLQTIEVSPRMNNTCSCPGTDTDVVRKCIIY